MRNITIALIVVLAGALVATDAMAQGRRQGRGQGRGMGGGRGGQMNTSTLLGIEKVAKAIGLTDTQKADLKEMRGELRGQRGGRGQRGNFQDMSEEDRQKMRDERAAQRAEQQKAEAEKLAAILDETQLARLEEIKLQIQGAAALLVPEVQKKLSLSDETVASLAEANRTSQEEMRTQMRELFSSGDRDGVREKATELRAAMQEKLLGVLSDTEKQAFTAMQGEKLEISPADLGGRRGGRGGANAGGRAGRGGRGAGGGKGRPELE